MKKVAKLILLDEDGNYLLMCRSNHPTFGNDPDLPGGTWEEGESVLETVIREVQEEIGVSVDKASIKKPIPASIILGTAPTTHCLYLQ